MKDQPKDKKAHIKKPKAVVKVPKAKERKQMPPASKKHDKKKGKGSYNRKKSEKLTKESIENAQIVGFINAIADNQYSLAHKYLADVINGKLSDRIEQNLNGPLF